MFFKFRNEIYNIEIIENIKLGKLAGVTKEGIPVQHLNISFISGHDLDALHLLIDEVDYMQFCFFLRKKKFGMFEFIEIEHDDVMSISDFKQLISSEVDKAQEKLKQNLNKT